MGSNLHQIIVNHPDFTTASDFAPVSISSADNKILTNDERKRGEGVRERGEP